MSRAAALPDWAVYHGHGLIPCSWQLLLGHGRHPGGMLGHVSGSSSE